MLTIAGIVVDNTRLVDYKSKHTDHLTAPHPMRLKHCHNIEDFRRLARRRLPSAIFHYIDGAADDESTYRRNTAAYDECDLIPNILSGVENIDLSTTIMGKRVDLPLFLSPTALQRLFHHDGERAVARAAEQFNTWFGISSLGTISIEEVGTTIRSPKMFQLYVHKDKGLTHNMIERCQLAGFDALALTVDTIVGGKRERDLRTGFTSPPRLTPASLCDFALHPRWSLSQLAAGKPQMANFEMDGYEFDRTESRARATWDTLNHLRDMWPGKLVVKGVWDADDAVALKAA